MEEPVEKESIKKPDQTVQFINRHVSDFQKHIAQEKDLTVIFLKSHLFIEYYLDHVVLLHLDTKQDPRRLTFYEKVKILKEKESSTIPENYFRCLYALNDIRNNLAHHLDFKISSSDIDAVGFQLGRVYVLEKYKIKQEDEESIRVLFRWIIFTIASAIFFPIYREVSSRLVMKESS